MISEERAEVQVHQLALPSRLDLDRMGMAEMKALEGRLQAQSAAVQRRQDDLGGFLRYSGNTWVNTAEDEAAARVGVRLSPEITIRPFNVADFRERADCIEAFINLNLTKDRTYLLLMQSPANRATGHAIAIHRTSGVFWQDWYIFDPNHGELKFDTRSYASAVLCSLFTVYQYQTVRVIEVSRRPPQRV